MVQIMSLTLANGAMARMSSSQPLMSSTAIDGPANSVGFVGHAVSPFVPVSFSNLVTKISFSEQFFEPSLGQTQQVSAVFAANSDWTLQIEDAYSNVVRTVTGSGTSMSFAWDGTGEGGTNIPNGVYYYYISAETNGETGEIVGGGGSGTNTPPPLPSSLSGGSSLWVVLPDSETVVPLKIYPPGLDTNGLDLIEASAADILELSSLTSVSGASPGIGGIASPNGSAAPTAQSAPPAPLRPPNPPCRGSLGKIAVAWQMYNANGTNPVPCAPIADNIVPGENVQIEGNQRDVSLPFAPFRNADLAAINFVTEMGKGCWDLGPVRNDNDLHISDLQGSGSYLNSADIAILFLHGGAMRNLIRFRVRTRDQRNIFSDSFRRQRALSSDVGYEFRRFQSDERFEVVGPCDVYRPLSAKLEQHEKSGSEAL